MLALRAKSEGKTLGRDIETAIRTTLASGTGMKRPRRCMESVWTP